MENYQIKTGLVVGIENDKIVVQLLPNLSGECGKSCHCQGLAMLENSKGPKISVKGDYKGKFQINDFVTVEANLPSPYLGIFFIFILPLIGLFAGAFLGNFFSLKYFSGTQQIFSIMGAAGGFLIAIGIAIFSDYQIRRKKEIFKIQEIPSIKQEFLKNCKNVQKVV